MNEERTAIINLALAGRLAAADAARMLDSLWALEMDEAIAVDPPCGEPPWLEGVTDVNELVAASRWPALLPASSRQIARALAEEDRRLLTMALGALDVMYLGEFPCRPDWTGYMLGGFALAEQNGTLHRGGTSIWTNFWFSEEREPPLWDRSIALWLFSEPLPLADAVREREAVVTASGTFPECVKMEYWVAPAPGGFVHGWGPRAAERHVGRSAVWLAPGVGPVRIVCEYADGFTATIELSAYASAGGGSYFPLEAGNWWRFDRTDSRSVRRELWRALTAQPDGWVWLSAAGYVGRNV
jgi:hypothetical protein